MGWSTYHGYNELMQERARVPTLKVEYLESRCKLLVIYKLVKSNRINVKGYFLKRYDLFFTI